MPSGLDWDTTTRGYTDHEQLRGVGLIHMNGRVYDPLVGRMMSADPFIPDPTSTQSFNRYSYVRNNPLNKTDPTGFLEETITTATRITPDIPGGYIGNGGGAGGGGNSIQSADRYYGSGQNQAGNTTDASDPANDGAGPICRALNYNRTFPQTVSHKIAQ